MNNPETLSELFLGFIHINTRDLDYSFYVCKKKYGKTHGFNLNLYYSLSSFNSKYRLGMSSGARSPIRIFRSDIWIYPDIRMIAIHSYDQVYHSFQESIKSFYFLPFLNCVLCINIVLVFITSLI